MPEPLVNCIPISRAVVCADCEVIYDRSAWSQCPSCASAEALPVSLALNRSRPFSVVTP